MTIKFLNTLRFLFLVLTFNIFCLNKPQNSQAVILVPEIVSGLGVKAYLYGYPLVLMDITRKVMTNVKAPTEFFAPINQFAHSSKFLKSKFDKIDKLEADVLYSSAWLDLEKEPLVLHVPNTRDRYYLIEALDNWTNVIFSIGKRTTKTTAQDFVFVGPDWSGKIPENLKVVKSSTNFVWLIGRTQTDNKDDYQAVNKIQKQYTIKPLSFFNKDYKPLDGKIDSTVDMNISPMDQVENMDGVDFFTYLSNLLKNNKLSSEDLCYLKNFEIIGLVPGKDFDYKKLNSKNIDVLDNVPNLALKRIYNIINSKNKINNGWRIVRDAGSYGNNYLKRAVIAYDNFGAALSEDMIYATVRIDSKGKPLEGLNNYIIHFDRDQIPHTKAFWSLTMYNQKLLFVDNPLKRYSLGNRSNLKYNKDGSLDIYLQKNEPKEESKKSNWLPSPVGYFKLILRVYWPEKNML